MPKETNKEKVLAALIESSSIREAAQISGVGEATVYRYLQDKEFIADYRSARRAVVENVISTLQQSAKEAAETLRRNLNCENPAVEIRAAAIILDNSMKGIELIDLTERIEAIENAVKK